MALLNLPVVLGLLLCLVATCHAAYSKFETNCSVPSSSVNFVSSPDSRGTLDILWSSLFTLFTCTWTIQHLNVPEQRNPASDKGFWADVKWTVKNFWNTAKWMIFTMLAPEYILGKAFGELRAARSSRDLIGKLAQVDKVEWSLSHSFFADMGGLVGVSEDEPLDENGQVNKLQAFALSAREIHWLRTELRSEGPGKSKIEKLPDITTAELLDKSKGDAFVKIISAGQVFWGALQIIVRAAKGLAISQLELSVAAFSACAVLTFLLLMYKPERVRVPIRPIKCEPESMEEVRRRGYLDSYGDLFFPGSYRSAHVLMRRISNTWISGDVGDESMPSVIGFLGMLVGCILFGSFHIAGWNFTFPTHTEQWLWRACSIYVAIAPLVIFAVLFIKNDVVLQTSNLVVGIVYVLVRIFMLVEAFRTLAYLPPDAYISTWASSLPHVT